MPLYQVKLLAETGKDSLASLLESTQISADKIRILLVANEAECSRFVKKFADAILSSEINGD